METGLKKLAVMDYEFRASFFLAHALTLEQLAQYFFASVIC
jgi:hypothetical protein